MRPAVILLTCMFAISRALPVYAEAIAESIQFETSAFENGGSIPSEYTCGGKDQSPAFTWSKGPQGTMSYAIVAEDPDAPAGIWTHWILYDLPPTVFNLPGAVPAIQQLANAEKHGMNDFGRLGYKGPCSPSGTHRYFFRMYALSSALDFKNPPKRDEFLKAIEGKVLAEGQWSGKYERKSK